MTPGKVNIKGKNADGNGQAPLKGRPFGNISRTLSEDDLRTKGVQKMLLNENDKLEIEVNENKVFRNRFHEADKELAVLKEKGSSGKAVDIFFAFSLAIGALLVGADLSKEGADWMLSVSGGVLLLSSMAVKGFWQWR